MSLKRYQRVLLLFSFSRHCISGVFRIDVLLLILCLTKRKPLLKSQIQCQVHEVFSDHLNHKLSFFDQNPIAFVIYTTQSGHYVIASLDCGLVLVTYFQWIDYGKSDGMSLPRLSYKRLWLPSWLLSSLFLFTAITYSDGSQLPYCELPYWSRPCT